MPRLLAQVALGVKTSLESHPKFWSLVQNHKNLSQNTVIIGWSFSFQFHHSLISSLQLPCEHHRGMGCAWSAATLALPSSVYMGFSLLAWLPEAIKVFEQIAPRHYTKRKKRRNLIKCSSLVLKWREYLTDAIKCYKNTTASELWSVFQLLPRVEKEST